MKIFEVSDARTGYVVGFDIYTGKNSTESTKIAKTLDPDCTQTTKTVVGLMQKCNVVRKDHHVYLDNYYCSLELFFRITFFRNICLWYCERGKKECTKSSNKSKIEEER